MLRILFLCTGNTCRSPLAEVFARALLPGSSLIFESAGLQVTGCLPASDGSKEVATAHGISLLLHRSQPVSVDLLKDTAWVIGMTRSHAAIFRSRYKGWYDGKVGVLGAVGVDLSELASSPICEEVNDPYTGNAEAYAAAGQQIQRLVQQWGPVFAELQS